MRHFPKSPKKLLKLIFPYLFLIFACICLTPRTLQNDTFYLIKIGDQLWNHGLDFKDHFAWTADLAYSYPHFLFNILCYLSYSLLGFNGPYILAIFFYIVFAFSLFYILETIFKSSKIPFVKAALPFLLTLLTVVFLRNFVTARSQVVTYSVFLWELFFIENLLKTGQKKYVFLLSLCSWLVAINHATIWPFVFIIFLPAFAELLLHKILKNSLVFKNRNLLHSLSQKFFFEPNHSFYSSSRAKLLGFSFLGCLLAGLLTPSRICYSAIFKISQGITQSYISEHAPLVLRNSPETAIFLLIFLPILVFTKAKLRLRDFFLFLGLTLLVFSANRHLALLLCLGIIPVSRLLENLTSLINPKFFEAFSFIPKKLLVFAAIVLLSISFANNITDPLLSPSIAPTEAVAFLKSRYPELNSLNLAESRAINTSLPIRLYNEYNQGAYILFSDIPVFMDSRVNIYTKPFSENLDRDLFVDYRIIYDVSSPSPDNKKGTNNQKNSAPTPSNPDKNYEELISLYSPTHFLLANDSTLAKVLEKNPSYEKIYSDDNFVIFKPLVSSK